MLRSVIYVPGISNVVHMRVCYSVLSNLHVYSYLHNNTPCDIPRDNMLIQPEVARSCFSCVGVRECVTFCLTSSGCENCHNYYVYAFSLLFLNIPEISVSYSRDSYLSLLPTQEGYQRWNICM